MKIIYFSTLRLPTEKAHGIQVMKTCEALKAAGAVVELVVPNRKNPDLTETDPFIFYSIQEKFKITRVSFFDPVFLQHVKSGLYMKGLILFYNLKLALFLKNKKFEDAAVAYTRDEFLLPVLQRYFPNVVWEAHNLPAKSNFYKKFWNRCKRIIVITSGLKEALAAAGVDKKNMVVVPDAVDSNFFEGVPNQATCRQRLGLPIDKKIILYTGHLYEWKGARTVLEAAGDFQSGEDMAKDAEFIFVGGTGHDIAKFKSAARDLKLQNIRIVGYRPHAEIPVWLSAADILVLPNSAKQKISQDYTSPMKLFEYMASGKPMLASDLPSLREVIDPATAYFFIPDDPQSLSVELKKMLNDPQSARARADMARQDVEQYTWSKRARKILDHLG